MGRLLKQGLDFLPLSVTIFEDDKIKFIGARFEERGELIVVKLLQEIYRHKGYYVEWNTDEATLFAKVAGKNVSPGLVTDVVNELLKRGFLDEPMYKRFSILTSYKIQRTYEQICKDSGRKGNFIKDEHRITAWNEVQKSKPPEEKGLTAEEIVKTAEDSTQTKGKERKLNETKGVEEAATREQIFKQNLLSDRIYLESECIKNRIDEEKYLLALEDFFRDKKNIQEDVKWQNESDCRKNFMYWLPKYLAAKASGKPFQPKAPDSTVYIPPKVTTLQDHSPVITTQTEKEAYTSMVESDIKKFTENSEFKPILAAKKLDWLIKNKRVELSIDDRNQYYDEAQAAFIQDLMDHMEYIPNRSLMDYYRANKSFRSEEQDKIKVIAKELAYMNFLKSKVTTTVAV